MSSNISEQMTQGTLGNVISFHFVFQSHFTKSRNCCPVTSNESFEQAFVCIMFCTTAISISLGTAVNISDVVWFACFQKSFFYRFVQCFWNCTCNETTCCKCITIFHEHCSLFSCNNGNFSHYKILLNIICLL